MPVADGAVFEIVAPARPATMLEWRCPSGNVSTPEEFVTPEPIAWPSAQAETRVFGRCDSVMVETGAP